MTLISLALLGMSSRQAIAPVVIGTFLTAFLLTGYPRMPKPRMFFAVLLMLPFALWWRYGLQKPSPNYVPVMFLYTLGFYMLSLATHHILAWRSGGSSDYAMSCAVMSLGIAGAGPKASTPGPQEWTYYTLTALFAVLLLVHLRKDQVGHYGAAAGRIVRLWRYGWPLTVMAVLGYAVQYALIPQVPLAGSWMVERLIESGGRRGFGHGEPVKIGDRLPGGWAIGADMEQVMLRVFPTEFAATLDPYLRGMVYRKYQTGTWSPIEPKDKDVPLKPLDTDDGRNIFNLHPRSSDKALAVVYPDAELAEIYHLPLGVHQVGAFAEQSWRGDGQTIRPDNDAALAGYVYYEPVMLGPDEQDEPTALDTYIPPTLRESIGQIARRAMPAGASAQEKIHRLEQWFADHFLYDLKVKLEHETDPILDFLENKHKGHCEYFATAATLLLRSQEIPARYVGGFYVAEPGWGGEYWIARRKHSHAWVEAWLEGRGWVTVEPTPPSALPQAASTGWEKWDWLVAQWVRFQRLAFHGQLFTRAWDRLVEKAQEVSVGVWLAIISAGVAWIFRKELRALLWRRADPSLSARAMRLRHALRGIERMLRRYGLDRPPGMTVQRYLQSVRAAPLVPQAVRGKAVPVLEEYVQLRYRPE